MTKAWWKSKTVWFNVASLAVLAGTGQLGIQIPANVAAPIVTIGNLALRLLTSHALSASDQPT